VSEPLRALLVEDSESDAKLITHELRHTLGAVRCERVDTPAALRSALSNHEWDVIVCDWSMPELDALGVIEILNRTQLDIPLIIASGTIGEEAAVMAMRAGARDYVLKDKLTRLPPAVEREVRERQARAERRRSEEALRVSEARFARLSESGVVGIVVADVFGGIHEANDAYLRIVGYTRDDLLSGKISWAEMTPAEFKHLADRAIRSLRECGRAPPFETELIRKDGVRMPVMVAVAMLDHPRCMAIITDLSERKRAEAALRRTEEQLRQAQKMEAIGILAGGVAHDFNNILSVILGYCGMLLEDLPQTDSVRGDIAEIEAAGQRGASMTRQLLAFSRHQIVDRKILNLNYVIRNVDGMLRRLIREDIDFRTVAAGQLGQCMADAGQLEQVIMNLTVNAIDAMPEGGTLTIETANVDLDGEYVVGHPTIRPGRYVMLAVSDTGIGMTRQMQERIFEPFFTTKEKGKGTGLGLSTVFGIVEQSGGAINVYSEPGRGSTFKVYLPSLDAQPPKAAATGDVEQPAGVETVLIVEDEDALRKVAVGILKRRGYRVLEGRNADEALRLCTLHDGPIELLLTDVVMPQMNGKQLAERAVALRPGIRVLYMSGYTDGILVNELSAGAAFLQKPFTPSALASKVRETLDSGPRHPLAPESH
jgi:two-component system cell cycle sensor histidine kinase/response regulator CckA